MCVCQWGLMGDRSLSSAGAGRNCALPMRLPNLNPALDKSCAHMGAANLGVREREAQTRELSLWVLAAARRQKTVPRMSLAHLRWIREDGIPQLLRSGKELVSLQSFLQMMLVIWSGRSHIGQVGHNTHHHGNPAPTPEPCPALNSE